MIKNALNLLSSEWKSSDPKRAVYAMAALEQIDSFDSLCASKRWTTGIEEVFQQATAPPGLLRKKDREGYAHFIYNLMKSGAFHGMAHEDPLGANVLIGSALSLFRKLIVEGNQSSLLPKALDLMLLQSIAYIGAGARDIARMQLMSIVDLTADAQTDSDDSLFRVAKTESDRLMNDILLRAAPAAFMLGDLFKYDNDEKRADASLLLAKALFNEVLEKGEKEFPGSRTELITAMMALSELALHQGDKAEGLDTLDRALWIVDADDALDADDQSAYRYVVSVANQRRAQLFMVQEDLDSALEHYETALSFAKSAFSTTPINTHYHDHYAALLNEVGILYGVQGNLVKSQDTFLLAIEERRVLVDLSPQYSEALVAALNNMATLMRKHNNKEVALVYLKDAIDIAEGADLDPEFADQLRVLTGQMEEKASTINVDKESSFGPN